MGAGISRSSQVMMLMVEKAHVLEGLVIGSGPRHPLNSAFALSFTFKVLIVMFFFCLLIQQLNCVNFFLMGNFKGTCVGRRVQ